VSGQETPEQWTNPGRLPDASDCQNHVPGAAQFAQAKKLDGKAGNQSDKGDDNGDDEPVDVESQGSRDKARCLDLSAIRTHMRGRQDSGRACAEV
jgi:hypothetical protein